MPRDTQHEAAIRCDCPFADKCVSRVCRAIGESIGQENEHQAMNQIVSSTAYPNARRREVEVWNAARAYDAARSGEAEGLSEHPWRALDRIRAWSHWHKEEARSQLRVTMKLIHDEALAALAEHPEPRQGEGGLKERVRVAIAGGDQPWRRGTVLIDPERAASSVLAVLAEHPEPPEVVCPSCGALLSGDRCPDHPRQDQPVDRASGEGTSAFGDLHVGRSWDGRPLEDDCPCPKEPCGLVSLSRADPACEQHSGMKTIRQSHSPSDCPGLAEHPERGRPDDELEAALDADNPDPPIRTSPEPLQDGGERQGDAFVVRAVAARAVQQRDVIVTASALGSVRKTVFSIIDGGEEGICLNFTDADALRLPTRDALVLRVEHPHQDVERELRAEISRLRGRTHEIAEAKDAEHAKAMRDYGRLREAIERAKERTANWQPSDTAVPSVTWSVYPGSWWTHSSHNSCMDVSALIVERDEALAELERLREVLSFYGNDLNYAKPREDAFSPVMADHGARARSALAPSPDDRGGER